MSAIAGICQTDGRPVDRSVIYGMLRAMAHRGPDGISVWCDRHLGLGHGLLRSLPEEWSDIQAIKDGGLAITADVRLDNRDELLAALGISDNSICDAALILFAYRRWGEDCPRRLLGDFAFALWDGHRSTLFCARDHFGVKAFYYHSGPDIFAFASEIKPLLALPGVPRELSEARVADFLVSIVADTDSTLYSGILRLPAGHALTVTPLHRRLRPFWQIEPQRSTLVGDAAEQFRDLFATAVRCRLRGVGPVGAMLSGGLDSSSIACVAAQILGSETGTRLPTFSLVFDQTPRWNERPFIEAVLAQGAFDPCFLASNDFPPFAGFEKILSEQDGPFLAPGLAMSRQVYSAAAGRGVRVLLDGHGGDEVVSHGHGRLRELANAGLWTDLWREVPGEAGIYGTPSWRVFVAYMLRFSRRGHVLRSARRAAARVQRRFRHLRGDAEARQAWRRYIDPDFAARTGVDERYRAQKSRLAACATERECHLGALTAPLQAYALEVLDKAAAGAGVEARYPFWDKRLVEFCLALPPEAKLSGGWSRSILRRAMKGILPEAVQWRRDKFDFTPQLIGGMMANHRSMVDQILLEGAEDLGRYVDLGSAASAYLRVVQRAEAADGFDVQAVWRTIVLALWLRQQRAAAAGTTVAHNQRRDDAGLERTEFQTFQI